jgi:hypothetical protein
MAMPAGQSLGFPSLTRVCIVCRRKAGFGISAELLCSRMHNREIKRRKRWLTLPKGPVHSSSALPDSFTGDGSGAEPLAEITLEVSTYPANGVASERK